MYNKALKIKPDFDVVLYNKACALALLSEKEEALRSLEKAIKLNSRYREIARFSPDFAKLRGDVDFEKILRE